jgi:hypothetical protein
LNFEKKIEKPPSKTKEPKVARKSQKIIKSQIIGSKHPKKIAH